MAEWGCGRDGSFCVGGDGGRWGRRVGLGAGLGEILAAGVGMTEWGRRRLGYVRAGLLRCFCGK